MLADNRKKFNDMIKRYETGLDKLDQAALQVKKL